MVIDGVGPWGLALAALAYLTLLFAVAEAAERGLVPAGWVQHPCTFVLSLGVYATSWTFYGSVGLASREGYGFLTIYLGVTLACLAIPILWLPLLRLVKSHQLSSVADLFAFRFQSQWVGAGVASFMLAASLPYVALQIRAVSDSSSVLLPSIDPDQVALAFCAVMAVFTILFGARHVGSMRAHPGLVVSMAFESAIKVLALVGVGAFALFHVFGGIFGLSDWLEAHPRALDDLTEPTRNANWASLTLLSFSAAFLLPRQFHMAFVKQPSERAFVHTMWLFPLLLLAANLPIPLVLWAADELQLSGSPDFFVLGVVSGHPVLSVWVFLGGLAAASGMVIVSSLALAGMAMNHLVLPVWRPVRRLYGTVTWLRRGLIALVIFAGYWAGRTLHGGVLAEMGLITFVAVLQLLPGLVGVVFWSGATRMGFVGGLLLGVGTWAALLILPLTGIHGPSEVLTLWLSPLGWGQAHDRWSFATLVSLSLNGAGFALLSVLGAPDPAEAEAARQCAHPGAAAVFRGRRTPEDLVRDLSPGLGQEAASKEIDRARRELGFEWEERRTPQLAQLEERVEANLSGLLGPMVARQMVGRRAEEPPALVGQIHLLQERLHGPTTSWDAMDLVLRYFGGLLEDLPLGVCAVAPTGEVIVWNQSLAHLSALPRSQSLGHRIEDLPAPWGGLLKRQAGGREVQALVRGTERVLRLGVSGLGAGGHVVLVEDLTEKKLVETRLAHHDRLQSIGRLAAGVAHEIGNPLSGILMVSRNLQREANPKDLRDRLGLVVSECSRIKTIVESLVAFSHAGHGVSEPPPQEQLDLNSVLQDALRLVRLTHREVPCSCASDEPLWAWGDAQKLTQVFVNLLSNACEASPSGCPVTIEVGRGEDRLWVAIYDQGEGIEPELQAHIFEPFFTTKEPGRGTGLGLAIAHRIVQDHGGQISVESQPSQGSCFTVELPSPGGSF